MLHYKKHAQNNVNNTAIIRLQIRHFSTEKYRYLFYYSTNTHAVGTQRSASKCAHSIYFRGEIRKQLYGYMFHFYLELCPVLTDCLYYCLHGKVTRCLNAVCSALTLNIVMLNNLRCHAHF